MSPALATTPKPTQAAIIRRVLDEPHPKMALGTIASNYGLTMVDLQAVLRHHGYPDRDKLAFSAAALENIPTEAAPRAAGTPELEDVDPTGNTGSKLTSVRVEDLHADPNNPREHLTDIEDLADSILSVGLLQPIVARRHGGVLIVVAGHRRLAAVRHLKWTHVDVIIRGTMRPDHVLAAMLIENGQRAGLDPIEEARALARLQNEHGIASHSELATLVGRNQVYVSGRLALIGLSAEEQEQVRAGTMNLTEATHRGRLNSGRVRPTGQTKGWHLSPAHDLANQVKARCIRLDHPRGRTVGSMGCGECWESVIRADERAQLMQASSTNGLCPTCGSQA